MRCAAGPGDRPLPSDKLNAVLHEYRALQEEKRTAYHAAISLLAAISAGTVAVASYALQSDKEGIIAVLLPAQIAVASIMVGSFGSSIRIAAYLSVVESRVNRIVDESAVVWESLNRGKWSASGSAVFRAEDPIASSLAVAVAIGALSGILELAVSTYWIYRFFDETWKARVLVSGYTAVMVLLSFVVLHSFSQLRSWASEVGSFANNSEVRPLLPRMP